MILKFDSSREIQFDGKEYNVPMKDENNNEINVLMDENNMNYIIQTGQLFLIESCNDKTN